MNRMTPNEFLQSGLLEEYTLGLLSDQRAEEVSNYIARHPSVRSAYDELQGSVQELADSHSVVPPAEVKGALMDALKNKPQAQSGFKTPKSNYLSWALATLIGAFCIYSFAMWRTTVMELEEQKSSFAQLKLDCEKDRKEGNAAKRLIAFAQNPSTKNAILNGNEKAKEFGLVAKYNSSSSQLTLDLLSPAKISSDQVLCLWGDKDGKMILIAKIEDSTTGKLISYDKDMNSLNVTIEENKANIDHPNVSQLIASSEIS